MGEQDERRLEGEQGERRLEGEQGERRLDGEQRERRLDGEQGERRLDGEQGERRLDGEQGERRLEWGSRTGALNNCFDDDLEDFTSQGICPVFPSKFQAEALEDNCLNGVDETDAKHTETHSFLFNWKTGGMTNTPPEFQANEQSVISDEENETNRKSSYASSESLEWEGEAWEVGLSDDLDDYDGCSISNVQPLPTDYEAEDWDEELNPYDCDDLAKPELNRHIGGVDQNGPIDTLYNPSLRHVSPLTCNLMCSKTEPGQFEDAEM
ncbi:uncharacterized protein O3C94_010586 [Discoglossus pictus]